MKVSEGNKRLREARKKWNSVVSLENVLYIFYQNTTHSELAYLGYLDEIDEITKSVAIAKIVKRQKSILQKAKLQSQLTECLIGLLKLHTLTIRTFNAIDIFDTNAISTHGLRIKFNTSTKNLLIQTDKDILSQSILGVLLSICATKTVIVDANKHKNYIDIKCYMKNGGSFVGENTIEIINNPSSQNMHSKHTKLEQVVLIYCLHLLELLDVKTKAYSRGDTQYLKLSIPAPLQLSVFNS